MNITKELLSDVFKKQIIDVFECNDNQTIRYYDSPKNFEEINKHELAIECKNWAFNERYIKIFSGKALEGDNYLAIAYPFNDDACYKCGEYSTEYSVAGDSELDAIFEVCEFIL